MGLFKRVRVVSGFIIGIALPVNVFADVFELTLFGTVDSVDSPLDSVFAVGDAFRMSVKFDESTGENIGTSDGAEDATRFNVLVENGVRQNSFSIGQALVGQNSPVGVAFIDRGSFDNKQRIEAGANNFNGPDVAGLVLRELYFDHRLSGTPLPGFNDPDNVLTVAQLAGLNTASFESGQTNLISYSTTSSSSDYKYIRFSLDSASIENVSPPTSAIVYYDQTGIADINGNGFPEFASLRKVTSGKVNILIRDAIMRDYIKSINVFDGDITPISISTIPDGNGNGADELFVMVFDNASMRTRTVIKDSLTGRTLSAFSWSQ